MVRLEFMQLLASKHAQGADVISQQKSIGGNRILTMEDRGEAAKVTRLASGPHLAVVQTERLSKS